jgi:DNA-binding response OmpR family regulator
MSKLPKILLIDDDFDFCKKIEFGLRHNFLLTCSNNGDDAFAKLDQQQTNFDLILLDLSIVNGSFTESGFSILKKLRREYSDIPVIVVSGTEKTEEAFRAKKDGAEDFIHKAGNVDNEKYGKKINDILSRVRKQPMIFLAFANSETNPLLGLATEFRNIQKIFKTKNDNQKFKINPNPFITPRDWTALTTDYKKDITIIHFGGHSNGEALQAQSWIHTEQLYGRGIAQKFGQMPQLKLVFLNGCANNPMVKHFLDEGVKVIIATSKKIKDREAVKFSEFFYKALNLGETIEEAFDSAKADIETINKRSLFIKQELRGLKLRRKLEKAEEFEWGLYANDDEALKWRLP